MTKQELILVNILLVFISFQLQAKAIVYEDPTSCINPNGRAGKCVSLYNCQSLLNVLQTRESKAYAFVRKCECQANGQGRMPYVCCTADTDFIDHSDYHRQRIVFPQDPEDEPTTPAVVTPRTTESNQEILLVNNELLPKPPVCGPVAIGNKIYGGTATELGEFPWLANLEYKQINTDKLVSVCAANIISVRYLLTAAHCIKGEIERKVGKLVSVRVGDHNTQTPVDCNNLGCIDPFQRMGFDELIVHRDYTSSSPNGYRNHNDIALIRTNRNIQYSISVAPICLPDALPQMPELRTGLKLSVAGWGHTGAAKYSAEKLKVDLPYVEMKNCPLKIAPEQLCAGGEFLKDSCTGDSGGGLVLLSGNSWVMEGIVSFGRGCGLEQPGVYTRVRCYIQWIHDNVLP